MYSLYLYKSCKYNIFYIAYPFLEIILIIPYNEKQLISVHNVYLVGGI